jgi:hypothetical protein
LWPGPGFPRGRSKLNLAGRVLAPKVSFLAPPRTHTAGHLRTFAYVRNAAVQAYTAVVRVPVEKSKVTWVANTSRVRGHELGSNDRPM